MENEVISPKSKVSNMKIKQNLRDRKILETLQKEREIAIMQKAAKRANSVLKNAADDLSK